jgi:NifU-like protein involved in Fe-S cluster formation
MKRFIILSAIAMLAGCGVETASTAATGAAIKKQEIQEGNKTQERMRKQVEQAADQSGQRAREGN